MKIQKNKRKTKKIRSKIQKKKAEIPGKNTGKNG